MMYAYILHVGRSISNCGYVMPFVSCTPVTMFFSLDDCWFVMLMLVYYCSFLFVATIVKSGYFLSFAVSPNIAQGPQNFTVIETDRKNVTLFCNATGRPKPRVSWIRVRDGITVAFGNTLTIAPAGRSDRGEYRCVADNGVGQPVSKSAYLDVHCKCIFRFCLLFGNDLLYCKRKVSKPRL